MDWTFWLGLAILLILAGLTGGDSSFHDDDDWRR